MSNLIRGFLCILLGVAIGTLTPSHAQDAGSLKTVTAAILTRGWGFNSVDDEMRVYKAILGKL